MANRGNPDPRRLRAWRWLILLTLVVSTAAMAQKVYKCTDGHGHLSFQDSPCGQHEKQQILHLHPPPPPISPAPTGSVDSASSPPPAAMPSRTAVVAQSQPGQVPQLYRCVRATTGKTYVSRNGHPPSYLAPLGIVGIGQLPLSRVYGGKDAARRTASDPQLARGRVTPGLIAGQYTRVQDHCRPMNVDAICRTLSKRLQTLEDRIGKAFRSDRPPLQRKADALRGEIAACPR